MATALWLMLGVVIWLVAFCLLAPFVLLLVNWWFDRIGNGRF